MPEGILLRAIDEHIGLIRSVAFSYDSKTGIFGSDDGTIRILDLELGENRQILYGFNDSIIDFVIAPDDQTLYYGTRYGGLWTYALNINSTDRILNNLELYEQVDTLGLSPEGNYLGVGLRSQNSKVVILDLRTNNIVRELMRGGYRKFRALLFPDENTTIVEYGDWTGSGFFDSSKINKIIFMRNLLAWTLSSRKSGIVNDFSVSPDQKILVTASNTSSQLWNIQTGEYIRTLESCVGCYWGTVDFSNDGKYITSGSENGHTKIWDVNTGNLITSIKVSDTPVTSVVFSRETSILATASMDNVIRLWTVPKGELLVELSDHCAEITRLRFSRNGNYLISGSKDGTIVIWGYQYK